MLAILTCFWASCSDGGSEDPVNPTPKPEEVKAEITIDSNIVSNGLSFGVASGEQSVSFSVNTNCTMSVASTTSGATWCKASTTSGSKGTANVKFTVDENTGCGCPCFLSKLVRSARPLPLPKKVLILCW